MNPIEVKNSVPELTAAAAALLSPKRVNESMARAGYVLTREHLAKVSGERDSGSRFYAGYVDVTTMKADEDEAQVIIPPVFNKEASTQRGNPLAAHYHGYTFTQANLTNSKYYTIPATDKARYVRAKEYPETLRVALRIIGGRCKAIGLETVPTYRKGRTPRRAERVGRTKGAVRMQSGKHAGMFRTASQLIYKFITGFKLKGGTGAGDKSVLPTEDEYADAAQKAVVTLLARGGAFR